VRLGVDLRIDQEKVLSKALNIAYALVDTISSNEWLK